MNKNVLILLISLSINYISLAQEVLTVNPAFKEFKTFLNLRDISISKNGK